MDIQAILNDWHNNNLTFGQIKNKYSLTDEQSLAIVQFSTDIKHIEKQLPLIKVGMSWNEIKEIMQ